MIAGIMADTHGHAERTRLACETLLAHRPGIVFHCGDIGSEKVLLELAGAFGNTTTPVCAVTGNVDLHRTDLMSFPRATGILVIGRILDVCVQARKIAVIHGDDAEELARLIAEGRHDYILTGHTHEAEIRRIHTTCLINPGAVSQTPSPSVAIVDLETGEAKILPLARTSA